MAIECDRNLQDNAQRIPAYCMGTGLKILYNYFNHDKAQISGSQFIENRKKYKYI